jgi:hypothetical protein
VADSKSYQYYDLAKPILPYKSFTSPVDETPHFVMGSLNIMASQIGYMEKRPGFSFSWGSVPQGKIQRIFGWRRWNAAFFTMLSVLDGGVSKVYKKQISTDADFVLIWTSVSSVPFDFIVSDNFCFFGNTEEMRKFDGTTVSKWGCDAPLTAPSVALQSGDLPPNMVIVNQNLSGTPLLAGTSQITWTVTDSVGATTSKTFNFVVNPHILAITTPSVLIQMGTTGVFTQTFTANYGTPAYTWSLFSGTIPAGLTLNPATGVLTGTPTTAGPYAFALKVTDSLSATAVQSFSLYVDNPGTLGITGILATGTAGVAYTGTLTAIGGTAPYTITYLAAPPVLVRHPFTTLPQGLTFTTASPNAVIGGTPTVPGVYQFRVLVVDAAANSFISTETLIIQSTTLSIDTITLPEAVATVPYSTNIFVEGGTGPYTYTYTAGTLDAQSGYVYGYSYTTIYGHESNVSPLSDNTGIFTAEDPTLLLTASPDPQVTGINVYRTTDGGIPDPAIMRLVASLPNVNQTYQDSTQDQFLGTQNGPGFLINTPPTPTRGFVWSNGRIYGMVDNKTFYSGFEEVSNGIPEEAWPSGQDGNFYAWPAQVGGMAVTENGVDIALSEQVWQISGDSLDTFRKSLIIDRAGAGSPTCINSVGNSVQWVDSAKQIWSSSLGEIGEPIRLDLTTIQPDTTFIGYHKSGNFNWIYVLDSLNSRLYIYDLDTDQWYPPWTVPATAIWSGETAVGELSLLVAIGATVYRLTAGTYTDALNGYEDDLKMNLIPISAGRTTSGRDKMEPRQLEDIQFEMEAVDFDGVYPAFVGYIGDSNPVTSTFDEWQDLTPYNTTPQYIPRRRTICQYRFIADSDAIPAIRASFWLQFGPADRGWKIYSLSISFINA